MPLLLLGMFAIGYSLLSWLETPGPMPLPIAGTGVILVFGALILVCGGVLGELIYKLGDVREQHFSRLTETTWSANRG